MKKKSMKYIGRVMHDLCKEHLSIPVMGVVTCVLQSAAPYITIVLLGYLIDAAYAGEPLEVLVGWAVIAIAGARLLAALAGRINQSFYAKQEYMAEITNEVFARKSLSQDYEYIESPKWQNLRQQFENSNRGNFGIYGELLYNLEHFTKGAVSLAAALVVMIPLLLNGSQGGSGFLAGNLSAIAVLILIAALLSLKYKKGAVLMKRASDMHVYEMAQPKRRLNFYRDKLTLLENQKDMRLYGQQKVFEQDYDKAANQVESIWRKANRISAKEGILSEAVMGICTFLIYAFVLYRAYLGIISVGDVVTIVSAISQAVLFSSWLAECMEDFPQLAEHCEFYCQYMDLGQLKYAGTIPTEKRSDNRFQIDFEHVSFKYPGTEEYVIQDLNLSFVIGEKMAIVGKNGSGKTTFIKLLCRLYDVTEGTIKLNGIDIRKYDYADYMKLFAVVFQDFCIFSFPLGENVASSDKVDEDRVQEALERAGMWDRIKGLPQGLATYVGKDFNETGIGFSGGEKQKMAIARSIYKDAAFVIMDEPTSALDPVAECQVFAGFDKMVGNKTALYISHRLASCRFCENILVFDKGTVVQQGSHEQLTAKEGLYRQLWNAQARYYS